MRSAWLVLRQGIYTQDVYGPFESEEDAREHAKKKASFDVDSYHEWRPCQVTAEGLGDWIFPIYKKARRGEGYVEIRQ